ncbi:MAG TPA: OsmC family protein [Firmicutes bacterium]|nr:OsmC family protein [Bacillota bacterium]
MSEAAVKSQSKRVELRWVGKLGFLAQNEGGRWLPVGTLPAGTEPGSVALKPAPRAGMTPMELVLVALGGCTGMDVVSILEKMREPLEAFTVTVEAVQAAEHPRVYTHISLTYRVQGPVDPANARRSAELSIARYCSVGAMLTRAVPVTYTLELNGGQKIDLGTKGGVDGGAGDPACRPV